MQFMIIPILLFSLCRFAMAKVVTVPAADPSIYVDQNFGEDDDIPGCDPLWFATVPGSFMMFNFSGTSVSVIGSTSSRGGVYDVYLDSKYQTTVDRYAPSSKLQCNLVTFQKSDLPYVQHNLHMIFMRNSTQSSSDFGSGYLDFSAIQYTVPDIVEKRKTPVGAIVGGVVGGVVALAIIGVLIWSLRRRKSESNRFVAHDLGQGEIEQFKPHHPAPSTAATPGFDLPYPYQPSSLPSGYHPEPFQWNANTNSAQPIAPFTNPVRTSVVYPPEKVVSLPQPHSSSSTTSLGGPSMMNQVPARDPVTGQARSEDIQRPARGPLARSSTTMTLSAPPAYE